MGAKNFSDVQGAELALAAKTALMDFVGQEEVASLLSHNPAMAEMVKGIGNAFSASTAQIAQGAAEMQNVARIESPEQGRTV